MNFEGGIMNLEDYFDYVEDGDIRIKNTRVGIETVLDDYLHGISPEEIALRYRSLTLEQIYATVTFYLRNQIQLDEYLAQWRDYAEASWQQQNDNPSPAIRRLLAYKERLLAEQVVV